MILQPGFNFSMRTEVPPVSPFAVLIYTGLIRNQHWSGLHQCTQASSCSHSSAGTGKLSFPVGHTKPDRCVRWRELGRAQEGHLTKHPRLCSPPCNHPIFPMTSYHFFQLPGFICSSIKGSYWTSDVWGYFSRAAQMPALLLPGELSRPQGWSSRHRRGGARPQLSWE